MFFRPRAHFGGRRHPHGHGGGGGGNLGVMLLIAEVLRIGLDHIPPITLSVVGLCTALYLQLIPIMRGLGSYNTCFNFMDVVGALGRGGAGGGGSVMGLFTNLPVLGAASRQLALSNLFHANDFHLYYNMVSWLYKGRTYELVYGSEFMLLWLCCAVVGTSLMYLLLCAVLVFAVPSPAMLEVGLGHTIASWLEPNACVVGFSGVIFCLKTVLNYYNVQAHGELDERIFIPFFGPIFNTPLRYAVWAELVVIQLFTPQVSFLGHMAGIMAGMAFIALDLVSWLQPAAEGLKALRETLFTVVPLNRDDGGNGNAEHHNQPPPPPRNGGGGGVGPMPRGRAGGFDAAW